MSAPVIAVLDYGIGNLRSAQKALQRVGADARLTADPAVVGAADGVVLPGVGNFGRCMTERSEVQKHGHSSPRSGEMLIPTARRVLP